MFILYYYNNILSIKINIFKSIRYIYIIFKLYKSITIKSYIKYVYIMNAFIYHCYNEHIKEIPQYKIFPFY